MTFSVEYRLRDRDRGFRRVLGLAGGSVSVGILGPKAREPDRRMGRISVGEKATYAELGRNGQPPRPVIGKWFDLNVRQNREFQREIAKERVLGRMTIEKALSMMGARAVGGMQKTIAAGVSPPNAPATIRRKKSSKPWIDSGQTRSSFAYRVNR